MVEFQLLGVLRLTTDTGRDARSLVAQPRRLALLAYLAAATPRGTHRRDTLLALFWPEFNQARARAALRQSLYVLRDVLGPAALVSEGNEEVGLGFSTVRCDVVEFDRLIESGHLREALDVYRGHLLEGFFISDAPEFERWLEVERARRRDRARRCASMLIDRADADGDVAAAASWARLAVQLAPDDEGLVRRLIVLLDAQGDRVGAAAVYEEFAQRVAQEYAVQPAAETKALMGEVRAREQARTPADLLHPASAAPRPTLSGEKPDAARARAIWPALGAAAAVLAVVVIAVASSRTSRPKLDPKRVVVARFENRTGDSTLDLLGDMAADWITRGLVQTGLVEVADARIALGGPGGAGIGVARTAAPPHAPRNSADVRALAEETGAGVVVWGAFYRQADSLRFETLVTDARGAKLLRALDPVGGPAVDPVDAVERLRQRVTATLGALLDPRLNTWTNTGTQPPTFEAYRAFVAGMDAYNRLDSKEALRRFSQAASFDSTYIIPLIAAARQHVFLNECVQVDSIARRLNSAHVSMSAVEQSLLDEAIEMCRGDTNAVYQTARRLADALPGSDFAAARVGRYAAQVDRPREAVAVLERLDPTRGSLRGWSPYYAWLTLSLHELGDHRRELQVAQRARQQYPDNLAMLRLELFGLAALGQVQEVSQRLDEVDALSPHPFRTPGTVMRETALELRAHGYPEPARHTLERALAWYSTRPPDEQASESYRFQLAQTLLAAGQLDSARALAQDLSRRHSRNVSYLGLLGVLAAQRDDQLYAESVDSLLGAVRDPYLCGLPTYWRAAIVAQLGEREMSVTLLTEATAQGLAEEFLASQGLFRGHSLHSDFYFEPLHGYPPFEQLLRPKG